MCRLYLLVHFLWCQADICVLVRRFEVLFLNFADTRIELINFGNSTIEFIIDQRVKCVRNLRLKALNLILQSLDR